MTRIADRYDLGDLIGQGGMGQVFHGTDTHTGNPVAIKVLRADLLASGGHHLERFVREGEMLRELDHPNIVEVLDTVQQGDQHFIVIEYVAGGSLADTLSSDLLALERVLSIALDVADALTRAHLWGSFRLSARVFSLKQPIGSHDANRSEPASR